MSPIRLGFIGLSATGWAAAALVPPLLHPLLSDKYTITAICTSSQQSASTTAEKYSKQFGHEVKAYHGPNGHEQIANDPNVDMIAITVKMPLHLKLVTPAIEAGKDIFIEWTPGNGYAETLKIAEMIKRKGVRCLVGGQAKQSSALKVAKGLLEAGKIGRVMSSSMVFGSGGSGEFKFWGPRVAARDPYGVDINNGATLLTIPVGHNLVALTDALGDFTEVTAAGTIRFPAPMLVDDNNQPTGKTIKCTSYDQVSLSGILSGKPYAEGAFVNIHCRSALLKNPGEKGEGRTLFKWIIDGEDGTIEVVHREQDGEFGCFISMTEKTVLLDGEKVPWEETEFASLSNEGKAWYEFAKGSEGRYTGIEDAVKIHRVLDAALQSIQEGRKVSLV